VLERRPRAGGQRGTVDFGGGQGARHRAALGADDAEQQVQRVKPPVPAAPGTRLERPLKGELGRVGQPRRADDGQPLLEASRSLRHAATLGHWRAPRVALQAVRERVVLARMEKRSKATADGDRPLCTVWE
jgi:hypothetical protein